MIPSKKKLSSLLATSSEEIINSGNPKYKFWMQGKLENFKNCKKDRTDMPEEPDDCLSYIDSVNIDTNEHIKSIRIKSLINNFRIF